MAKNSIYTTIFDIYELNEKDKSQKRTMRRLISRHFDKIFKDKKWENLSELEKKYFVYIHIQDSILECYIPYPYHKKIKDKIKKEIDKFFLDVIPEAQNHNNYIANIYKTYYNSKISDEDNKKNYTLFCNDLRNISREAVPPRYEEWLEASKKNYSPRIYDYIMPDPAEMLNDEISIKQSEIDHVILETIIKILADEFKIQINIPKIVECLAFIKNNAPNDEYEPILYEYNSKLSPSREEQNKIISRNLKYLRFLEILDNLDFYEKK